MPFDGNQRPEGVAGWDEHYASGAYREHADGPATTPDLAVIVAAGHIPAGGVTLDLGCGAGTDAIFLAGLGFRSIGIDMSGEAIKIARARAADARVMVDWREGSVLELPFADSSIHFAQDRGCFHHIEESDRERYTSELARVLVPGARFLLSLGHEAASAADVDETFSAAFSRGPVVPYLTHADGHAHEAGGQAHAYLVFLERR